MGTSQWPKQNIVAYSYKLVWHYPAVLAGIDRNFRDTIVFDCLTVHGCLSSCWIVEMFVTDMNPNFSVHTAGPTRSVSRPLARGHPHCTSVMSYSVPAYWWWKHITLFRYIFTIHKNATRTKAVKSNNCMCVVIEKQKGDQETVMSVENPQEGTSKMRNVFIDCQSGHHSHASLIKTLTKVYNNVSCKALLVLLLPSCNVNKCRSVKIMLAGRCLLIGSKL